MRSRKVLGWIAVCGAVAFGAGVMTASGPEPRTPAERATTPQVRLTEVDGGPRYYGRFSNPLPSDAGYFPLAVWLQPVETQEQVDLDKDLGLNLYVGVACPECANEELIRSNGMQALIQANERTRFDDLGSEVVGWVVEDEPDMLYGPGWDRWNDGKPWPRSCKPPQDASPPGQCGYTALTLRHQQLPADGRMRYANFGKGVLLWETTAQARRFVNMPFLGTASADAYWFTDVQERRSPRYGKASSYGRNVARMRYLDGLDGQRKPIWGVVETGWPNSERNARAIRPAEIRAAVWHSLIAGARGIMYFAHSFGGPPGCESFFVLREVRCYARVRAIVKAVNRQIKTLAPVLNSPNVTSGWTAGSSVRAMVKWRNGRFYVFAGARGKRPATGRFSMPCLGDAQAVRLGERGSVPVEDGSFSDSFVNGNAIHIYRIDGGSTCGLPTSRG